MNKGLIFAAALAVVALSSCTTINDTAYTTVPETMVVNMTVADIDVSQKQVTATTTYGWNPFRTTNSRKANAEAKALRESGADVLVEPTYEIENRGIFRGGSVTVTGHPGKFVNFRNMTSKDAEIISTLNGTLGVATPMIKTSAPSLVDRLRPKKGPKPPKPQSNFEGYKNLIDLHIGGGWGYNEATSLGIMYGHYVNKWGWYAKGTIDWAEEYETQVGFSLTGGAMRALPQHFTIFFGTGVGVNTAQSASFNIPIDLGFLWNYRHFNIGLTLQPRLGNDSNFNAYIGLGYNF